MFVIVDKLVLKSGKQSKTIELTNGPYFDSEVQEIAVKLFDKKTVQVYDGNKLKATINKDGTTTVNKGASN